MKLNEDNTLTLDKGEMLAVAIMLEDLPHYLALDKVNNSALAEVVRQEFLAKFKEYEKRIGYKG